MDSLLRYPVLTPLVIQGMDITYTCNPGVFAVILAISVCMSETNWCIALDVLELTL